MVNLLYTGTSLLVSSLAWSHRLRTQSIRASFNENDKVVKPPYKISIVMPSYNEETLIEYALSSIKEQNILKEYPDDFELVLVDSNSTDNTVNIARNYVNKIVYTPKGKLTARNLILNHLNGDIIVSVDADCYYPLNWLNLMLKPFHDNNIVAECGFTLDIIPGYGELINKLHPLGFFIYNMIYENKMSGRNSAYYKDLQYLEPFNENINQFNAKEMVKEEEIDFGIKLSKYGRFIFNSRACCLHLGSVKGGCRSGINPKNKIDELYCDQIKNNERF